MKLWFRVGILKFGFELDWIGFWSSVKICDFGGMIWVVGQGERQTRSFLVV